MPAPMPSAPWLTPKGDPAQDYLHGYGLGEQAASETAQLAQRAASEQAQLTQRSQQMQQQAQQTQRELDMQQQQQERQHLMDQQRLEITKSYHEQQAALGQQKLQQAAQANQAKIQEIARVSQIKQQAQKEIDGGADPVETWAKYGPAAYGAGGAGYENAYANQQRRASLPTPQTPEQKADMALDTDTYKKLEGAKVKLQGELASASGDSVPKIANQITELTRQQNAIRNNRGLTKPAVPTADTALPMPKTKDDLEKGKVYQTKRGPAKWDGEKFVVE